MGNKAIQAFTAKQNLAKSNIAKSMPSVTLFVLILAMLVGLLWNHYHLITYPALLDYYEGAMPAITGAIISGVNPYAFDAQPTQISVYPPFYHLVVAPFSQMFGNTLLVHRVVSGGFIWAAVFLCYQVTLRISESRLNAFLAAVIFYAGLLYFSTPVASSNSIGLFFFLLTVALPWLGRFTYRSLLLALLTGLIAFFCKQYFLAALGYIALYLFLCISKKKALIFSFCFLVSLAGSLALVQVSSPYYLDDVIFILRGITGNISSFGTSFTQLVWFLKIYIGLVVLVVIQVVTARRASSNHTKNFNRGMAGYLVDKCKVDLKNLDRPLLLIVFSYFWFCFFCSFLVIALVIGKNPGNQMTYLFQLMTPLFLIAVFSSRTGSAQVSWLQTLLITFTMYTSYSLLPTDFSYQEEGWDRLEQVLVGKAPVYASPLVLPLLRRENGEIFNNGLGPFFYFSRFKPEVFNHPAKGESNTEIWEKHVHRVHGYLREKKFALIVLDPWTRIPELVPDDVEDKLGLKLLRQNYRVSESITVSMAKRSGGGNYKLKVWIPRK